MTPSIKSLKSVTLGASALSLGRGEGREYVVAYLSDLILADLP